jgi:hypothetical protein
MRKLSVIILCCLALPALQCSRKPKPKTAVRPRADSVLLAERMKELEFTFPPEALAPLSEPQVVAYANALPGVVEVLRAAGFKAPYLEGTPREVYARMGWLADTMRAVPGFDSTLSRAGLSYSVFRSRFVQVWAAGYAIVLDSTVAALRSQESDTLPEVRGTLMVLGPWIRACSMIPPVNKGLARTYRPQLSALGKLL